MGAIQSAVNSGIGTAAMLAGLYANTPAGKARGEARVAASTAKKHGKAIEKLKGATYTGTPAEQEAKKAVVGEQIEAHTEAQLNNLNRAAMVNPSETNVRNYTQAQAQRNMNLERQDVEANYADDTEGVSQGANNRAGQIAEQQGQQAQNLADRLKAFRELPMDQRRAFLREAGHYQYQDNKTNQHRTYEEGKKYGGNI